MLKTFLGFSALVALTTVGCLPARDAGEPAPVDPGAAAVAPTGEAQGGEAQDGAIAFGAEPTGAVILSTASCPALAMPPAAGAATLFVDAQATGAEDGSREAPFRTVAKAFAAATAKAVLWVAEGTYEEQLLVPNRGVTVLGGFAHGFGARTNACATVLEAPNANAPVLSATTDVKSFAIEGVMIQKSERALLVLGDDKEHGTVTIARCVFAGNGSKSQVGGAVFLDSTHARIFGSVFRDNVGAKGAALAAGGDVTLTIDQNLFLKNLGYSDHGGGVYLNAAHAKISRNTFRGNATGVGTNSGWGGAIIVYSNSLQEVAKADFSFNVFTENTAGIGGAVFVDDGAVVTMSHDLLYRNRAYAVNGFVRGAAIYVDGTGYAGGGSTFTAEFLTVVNNVYDQNGAVSNATFGGNAYIEGFSKASFTNSIFWNNGDSAFYVAEGANELSVANSIGAGNCVSGNAQGLAIAKPANCKIGAGVLQPSSVDFGDEAANDYHEKSAAGRFSKGMWIKDKVTSAAIDKADPTAAVDEEPMPNGNRANLGCFSRTIEASKSP